ncbi:Hypothetical protein NTJ_07570 [Nesidiocoris tenuis]|uniref:Uncharacterized protein n=1 Tax=Nesidiocoris tenuis TaxID=355587 RepID=A0ABN7ARC4_9HEMI|nr:Hypothetical protein NTJ_07570 [Nesidiocoris tenuis]
MSLEIGPHIAIPALHSPTAKVEIFPNFPRCISYRLHGGDFLDTESDIDRVDEAENNFLILSVLIAGVVSSCLLWQYKKSFAADIICALEGGDSKAEIRPSVLPRHFAFLFMPAESEVKRRLPLGQTRFAKLLRLTVASC